MSNATSSAQKIRPKREHIGVYSARHRLRNIDRRTTLGRHIRAFELGLIEHCGGNPSLPIRSLIDQAVGVEMQIVLLEQHGINTDHDRRCYASWLNAKRLTLRELGLKPAAPRQPTLTEHLAAYDAQAAPAPAPRVKITRPPDREKYA